MLIHMLHVGWWCHGYTLCHQYMLKLLDVVDVGLGQFSIGQLVHMMNFKSPQQIVALGTISGVWGVDKFNFKPIPQFFYKVDVTHAQVGDAPLMHPHAGGDQFFCIKCDRWQCVMKPEAIEGLGVFGHSSQV